MENGKTPITLELLTKNHADAIPNAYIPVFQDHPWHEEFECGECGTGPYSFGCKQFGDNCEEFKTGKLFLIKSDKKCEKCGNKLKPVYTHSTVKEDYLDTRTKKSGFLGVGAFNDNRLIGFCWGFDFPQNHPAKTGSTWYKEAGDILEKMGFNPKKVFYHNESGTLYDYRNKGIGTRVLKEMLTQNINTHEFAVFRTINLAMVRCYEKAFNLEKNELKPAFNDPNPDKRQEWYVLDLNKLK